MDSFYEKLKQVFNDYPIHHIKALSANWEDINSLHETYNDGCVRV